MVFIYLLGVFKYLTITYKIILWKKYALSLITVHILGLHDFAELSEDQRHMFKIFDSLQYVVETQMSLSLLGLWINQ